MGKSKKRKKTTGTPKPTFSQRIAATQQYATALILWLSSMNQLTVLDTTEGEFFLSPSGEPMFMLKQKGKVVFRSSVIHLPDPNLKRFGGILHSGQVVDILLFGFGPTEDAAFTDFCLTTEVVDDILDIPSRERVAGAQTHKPTLLPNELARGLVCESQLL